MSQAVWKHKARARQYEDLVQKCGTWGKALERLLLGAPVGAPPEWRKQMADLAVQIQSESKPRPLVRPLVTEAPGTQGKSRSTPSSGSSKRPKAP
jgi:hypothetical protein